MECPFRLIEFPRIPMNKLQNLNVSRKIDPKDQMWESGPKWYFQVGESGLDVIKKILTLSRKRQVTSILDLPCGHGRVGRFLRAAFSEARITYCDLDAEGIAFCANEFGGIPLLSKPELSEVEFSEQFDVIWVGSLFTHVDHERTQRWLNHLCAALAPDGILVATFHGRWTIEVQEKYHHMIDDVNWQKVIKQYDVEGYGFASYPSMASSRYGISLARASNIVQMVECILGVRMLAYIERGWADNHDVLGLAKTDRLQAWPSP
jgi:SAM-dependent methyltransferase